MSPINSRKRQEGRVVLRLLVTVCGWVFTGILVYVLAFHNMGGWGASRPMTGGSGTNPS